MIISFNDAYKIARVLRIEKELQGIPNMRKGTCNSKPVVREYGPGGKTLKIHYLTRPVNAEYLRLAERRMYLMAERKRILSSLDDVPSKYCVQISAGYRLNRSDWEKMKSQSNPKEIKGDLWFENLHMRSRFEVNTAMALRGLGLEFKYEPQIRIGNKIKYPDFVVYLPEFEVCFIIECMGRVGDEQYDADAENKLKLYMDGGFIPFRDFLILGGSSDFIPVRDWVINAIVSVVNSIASECVFPLGQSVKVSPSLLPPDIEAAIARMGN